MKRSWLTAAGVVALGFLAPPAFAADHADGPQAKMDPSADITDVYGWTNSDASKVYLVMNVNPKADKATSKFSDKVQYVFHTNSRAASFFSDPVKGRVNILCTFGAPAMGKQTLKCWAVDATDAMNPKTLDYAEGDASATSGLESRMKKFKVFAGPRNDPFFFNLDGFNNTVKAVQMAAGGLMFDMNGCPKLDAPTAMALGTALKSDATGKMPGKDTFAGQNVLSIVVAIDKTLLIQAPNKVLGVWASTRK